MTAHSEVGPRIPWRRGLPDSTRSSRTRRFAGRGWARSPNRTVTDT